MNNIGFMQGRLCDQIDGLIQAFPWDNWRNEFQIAPDLGFDLIEWTLDSDGLYENPLLTTSGQSDIKNLSNKFGVKVVSVTGDCFMQTPFWKIIDSEKRSKLVDELIAVVDACSAIDVNKIVVPLVDNGRIVDESEEARLLTQMKKLSKYLRKKNVQIIFETDFSPTKNKNFISKFPLDTFGINYDSGNSAALGYSVSREFELFSTYVKNVHIKDRKLNGETVPLGEGNADFTELFRCLKNLNYKGNLILQTARASNGDHAEALVRYRDFVKACWLKL